MHFVVKKQNGKCKVSQTLTWNVRKRGETMIAEVSNDIAEAAKTSTWQQRVLIDM